MKRGFRWLTCLGILTIHCTGLKAAEISVLASGATREATEDVAPKYEKSTGHTLKITWAGSVDIRKKIGAGEIYDSVVASGPDIDAFIKDGKLTSGSRVDLMKSGMGVAVKLGTPKPDIKTPDGIKAALLSASSIGYSSGPSGTYLESMMKSMGIYDQAKGKMKQPPSGMFVGSMLVAGQVDIGVQQISELIHYPGIDYLGPLPPEIQNMTQFSAGVHTNAPNPEAAKDFIRFLASPQAADAIRRHGMEPG